MKIDTSVLKPPSTDATKHVVTKVMVGEIIRSPQFKNLIFKDIIDLDAACGFKVNAIKRKKQWDNTYFEILESPGKIKKNSDGKKAEYRNLKQEIDPEREFVVVYIRRNTDFPREHNDEEDFEGHYPLQVTAKMLAPDGEFDPFGIEITFNMESKYAGSCVEEVELCGVMSITYKRAI